MEGLRSLFPAIFQFLEPLEKWTLGARREETVLGLDLLEFFALLGRQDFGNPSLRFGEDRAVAGLSFLSGGGDLLLGIDEDFIQLRLLGWIEIELAGQVSFDT